MLRPISILTVLCIAISGCATIRTEGAFDAASQGMSKSDIIKKVGRPAIVRGIVRNDDCQTLEVWEYKAGKAKDFEQVAAETVFSALTMGAGSQLLLSAAETSRYWIYFVDGKFAGWSRAGDWERDADKVKSLKFKPASNWRQKM